MKTQFAPQIISELTWKKNLEELMVSSQTYCGFSTLWKGIVTSPALMLIPFEDHLVHRGDGVFEAVKVVAGQPYLWAAHWKRLQSSASRLNLEIPLSIEQAFSIVQSLVEQAGCSDLLLRIFVSRGPGGFGVNMRDSTGSHLSIFATPVQRPSAQAYAKGVSIMASSLPAKESFFARIKSCNYLLNVLMKEEALSSGYDYAIGISPEGKVLESSTENLIWIDSTGKLCCPKLQTVLTGTTMVRLFELVVKHNICEVRQNVDCSWSELQGAAGVFLIGTTIDVLPVGRVGACDIPISDRAAIFLKLIQADQREQN